MLSAEDNAIILAHRRKVALQRLLAEELRAEIKRLEVVHPDWPASRVRAQAELIVQDAMKQAKVPH